jgi:hypothetical protein
MVGEHRVARLTRESPSSDPGFRRNDDLRQGPTFAARTILVPLCRSVCPHLDMEYITTHWELDSYEITPSGRDLPADALTFNSCGKHSALILSLIVQAAVRSTHCPPLPAIHLNRHLPIFPAVAIYSSTIWLTKKPMTALPSQIN